MTDTALWVAVHRGREGLRKDPLYKDPLALKLAGERGLKIARKMASTPFMSWMMSLRTVAIDGLIQDALDLGVTTVLNLGAGLDTRPYRMEIKGRVDWIEVDFPGMIAYKNTHLASEVPLVSLERLGLDLNDRDATRAFLRDIDQRGENVLVITEGVIPYLSNEQAAALADDLAGTKSIKYWIQDFRLGGYALGIPKLWLKIRMRKAPFKFDVADWFGFFDSHGWVARKRRPIADLARENHRPIPTSGGMGLLTLFMSKKTMQSFNQTIGFALLEKKIQAHSPSL